MADPAYGPWPLVVLNTLLFIAFATSFFLNDLIGWKYDPHLSPFHLASYVAIGAGFWLIAAVWKVLHEAAQHDRLATTGHYAHVRQPQYDGFVLVMIGFLLQWPTIPVLIMFPVLVYVYARLAGSEVREVVRQFGPEWDAYAGDTPRFAPRRRKAPPSTRPHNTPAPNRRPAALARTATASLLAAGLLTLSGPAAFAHDGEGSDRAFDLVRQGIAYLVTRPHDSMDIEDKINDSLEAKDTSHVDLAYVRKAQQAFKSGDLTATRVLLERSIGARLATTPADPVPINSPLPITGAETGTLVVADPLPGRGPLHAGDWGLLGASAAAGAAGVVLAIRVRPHNTRGGGTS
ncbi:methyltransferase family protein [Streptomyces sp. NPDC101165]|uniref:methyltransferase family protein n=1 Tax=Streptomyces sp. NPDC101165 TaxID=3366119 RepID=UPI00382946C1